MVNRHRLEALNFFAIFQLALLPATVICQENLLPLGSYQCLLRCTAKCLEDSPNSNLQNCRSQCLPQAEDDICADNTCWKTCNGLLPSVVTTELETPKKLLVDHSNPSVAELTWDTVPKAELYVIQYKDSTTDAAREWKSTEAVIANLDAEMQIYRKIKENTCGVYQYRVAAVNSKGFSPFSAVATLNKPVPEIPTGTTLEMLSLVYVNKPWLYPDGELADKDMINLDLGFTPPTDWDLNDLKVELFVIPYRCAKSGTGIIPTPTHVLDVSNPVLHVKIPGVYMRWNCHFAIKLVKVQSKKCSSEFKPDIPHVTLRINCNTVSGAPCKTTLNRNPMCGFTNFTYRVLTSSASATGNDVEISWRPLYLRQRISVLYFSVRWGEASSLSLTGDAEVDKLFSDFVIIEQVIGTKRTCDSDTPDHCYNTRNSIVIPNLLRNKVYGVQICAVYSRDKEFPERELRLIQTNKLLIN